MAKIFPVTEVSPSHAGIPIEKAMDEHTLIALKMNGETLPAAHGFPARLIVPGWIGSAMQKWLNRIWVRDQVHDSEKMSGYSYRIPAYPIAPGDNPPVEDMRVATAWQVKSLITRPETASGIWGRRSCKGERTRMGRRKSGGYGPRLHRFWSSVAGNPVDTTLK